MAKFLVPSVIGIILFMIPVKYNGDWTVCVKILADIIGGALGGFLPILCVAIITVSAIMSVISLAKPKFITEHPILNDTFSTSIIWVVVRVIGAALVWLTYLGLDAEDGKTGFFAYAYRRRSRRIRIRGSADCTGNHLCDRSTAFCRCCWTLVYWSLSAHC